MVHTTFCRISSAKQLYRNARIAHTNVKSAKFEAFFFGANGHAASGNFGYGSRPVVQTDDPVSDSHLNAAHFRNRKFPVPLTFAKKNRLAILRVEAGCGTSFFVTDSAGDNHLLGAGVNTHGQISPEPHDTLPTAFPVRLPRFIDPVDPNKQISPRIRQIACGRAHVLILTRDHGVIAQGDSSYGQCGVSAPSGLPASIASVHCGHDHSLVLTHSGTVFAFGLGVDGQLGLGRVTNQSTPRTVDGLPPIKLLATKGDSCVAIDHSNCVWAWGSSEYNQFEALKHATINVVTPRRLDFGGVGHIVDVKMTQTAVYLLNASGEIFVFGSGILGLGPQTLSSPTPLRIPPALFGGDSSSVVKVVSLTTGLSHVLAGTSDGGLFGWGVNSYGQTGTGRIATQFFPMQIALSGKVVSMAAGYDHSLVVVTHHKASHHTE